MHKLLKGKRQSSCKWWPSSLVKGALLLLISASFWASADARIDNVRLWQSPDNTRLVFDLSSPIEHSLFTITGPDRIVIDIKSAAFHANLDQLDFNKTPINRIRYAQKDGKDLRIVLDLSEAVSPRSFVLGKNEQYGDRLVVDLQGSMVDTSKSVESVVAAQKTLRDIVVAIDPGHGGEDPGASGPNKIREKEVVLAISKELKRLIDATPGYKAVLIREGDYYVGLRDRVKLAHKHTADFFVSIHADAFTNPQAHGASVYALSLRGATSETARFLAQRENNADLIGGVGNVNLAEVDSMVAELLVDLSMTATLSSSLEAGDKVLSHLGKVARLHKKKVEQASFVVLKSPDIPSILVETGFISNPGEAKKLGQASYRNALANSIYKGITDYFGARPPVGTWLAAKGEIKERVYVIASGDTLSHIAARNDVTLSDLMRHNNLSSKSVIKVGQRIRIPPSKS